MVCLLLLAVMLIGLSECSFSQAGKQSEKAFRNPILAGFYPDPSICRVGEDYFLVNSSFSYFPGIPIFQSKDLVHWTLIGHVLDRPEQLNLDGLGVSRGIFAPAIRYNEGVFYVTCTLVDRGGNFVVTSTRPEGPWSKPVWLLQVNGIDPSLFFDGGRAFLLYNSIAPDDKPLYDGHRTLRMMEFDPVALSTRGKELVLVDGGTNLAARPVWIEGPHVFKKEGYYYLIAAEGGTAENHSEVVFRGISVTGPYVPWKKNPILTQRNLDPGRDFPITCTGHADFVETPAGEWWSVFLGCRPYRPFADNCFNTGRETFLAPVRWQDGWPRINPGHKRVQYAYPVPVSAQQSTFDIPRSGNFTTRDDFTEPVLNKNWMFLRTPRDEWFSLTDRPGYLAMRLQPASCADSANPAFIGRRQQHAEGSVTAKLEFAPQGENEKAGLLVFQNERHFYFLCVSDSNGSRVVELYASSQDERQANHMERLASEEIGGEQNARPVLLRIEAHGNTYSFFFADDSERWTALREHLDAAYLSTKKAAGFVGCVYAMYATSLGLQSNSAAYFDWFGYKGDDEVYR